MSTKHLATHVLRKNGKLAILTLILQRNYTIAWAVETDNLGMDNLTRRQAMAVVRAHFSGQSRKQARWFSK